MSRQTIPTIVTLCVGGCTVSVKVVATVPVNVDVTLSVNVVVTVSVYTLVNSLFFYLLLYSRGI